jgi:hypothetical protein
VLVLVGMVLEELFFAVDRDAVRELHGRVAVTIICLSAFVFAVLLLFVPSPYGKSLVLAASPAAKSSSTVISCPQWMFGPQMPARLSWIVFESPNLLWIGVGYYHYYFAVVKGRQVEFPETMAVNHAILLGCFGVHYLRRTLYYPLFQMKINRSRPIPFLVVLFAFSYCLVNGL